jgi:hypothetical protein
MRRIERTGQFKRDYNRAANGPHRRTLDDDFVAVVTAGMVTPHGILRVGRAGRRLREATELYLEEFPLKTSGQPLVTTFQVAVNAVFRAYQQADVGTEQFIEALR